MMAAWSNRRRRAGPRILDDQPDAVSALARHLRATALAGLPDLPEQVYPGWRALGLRRPAARAPTAEQLVTYLDLALEHAGGPAAT